MCEVPIGSTLSTKKKKKKKKEERRKKGKGKPKHPNKQKTPLNALHRHRMYSPFPHHSWRAHSAAMPPSIKSPHERPS
jgi:hypothetical protein